MAHEIDMSTGEAAVFVAGQPAWHGLGQTIEAATTSREAIDLAGLDWQVKQWPLTSHDPDSLATESVPGCVANIRTDIKAVLGVVGIGYRVFQNREAFDFMDAIVGDKLAMYETAGSLKGGRQVWMLARIPREYRAGKDDLIKPYVLLVNSHDGSTSLRMIPTTVRVVCQNTLNLALRNNRSSGGEGIAIRHCGSLDQRVREARRRLGVVAARFDQFDAELHAMLEKTLSPGQVARYFEGLLPRADTERKRHNRLATRALLMRNFENEKNTLPGMKHTAWAAYNAVSEWADHQRQFRSSRDSQKFRDVDRGRAESRLHSVWFGSSHHLKQKAYRQAVELAALN